MASLLLTGPAAEPLTLAETKAFLRVDDDAEDDLIASLIVAARAAVEAGTRRALVTQSWRLVRDAWPADGRIAVRPAPLAAVTAARVYDDAGAAHAVDTEAFVPDLAASVLGFAPWAMPQPGRAVAGIEIDISVGYGDAASAVPEPLRQAVRLLVAQWYENRTLVAPGQTVSALPATVAALVSPYRVLSL